MIEDEIVNYIHAANIAQKAVNLFEGVIPAHAPLPSIGVIATGGPPPEECFDMEGIAIEHPSFQVTVRGETRASAREKIYEIFNLLVKVCNQDVSAARYLHIGARGSPGFLELDENQKAVWVANFDTARIP